MPDARLDVLAFGDAMVDVIATTDDAFLIAQGLVKGSMRLIDTEEATRLYGLMGQARETSGGSAANTVAGIAAMGGRAGFVGQVASDQLGEVFAHDIRALGVEYLTPVADSTVPTGRCLILVTPDAQRTMNTCAGVSHCLSTDAIDPQQIRDAAILYLEAYLWVPEAPRAAMQKAIGIAHDAGRKVALTLSDIACIAKQRASFLQLIDAGEIDLLFANEQEILALAATDDLDLAISSFEHRVPLLVVTRSEKGAIAIADGQCVSVPVVPAEAVIDTTGAGDLFAAGFLTAQARGRTIEESLWLGAAAAAAVISQYGARPAADLRSLLERFDA